MAIFQWYSYCRRTSRDERSVSWSPVTCGCRGHIVYLLYTYTMSVYLFYVFMHFYQLDMLRNRSSSPSMATAVGARLTVRSRGWRSVYDERSVISHIPCISCIILLLLIYYYYYIRLNHAECGEHDLPERRWTDTAAVVCAYNIKFSPSYRSQIGVRFPTVRLRHGPQRREETVVGQQQRRRFPTRKRKKCHPLPESGEYLHTLQLNTILLTRVHIK